MSTAPTWSDLVGRDLLDLAAREALPEDTSRRIELAEGVLVVAARPVLRHQMLTMRLAGRLDAEAGGRWRRLDRVLEPHEYAEVGVPWYLLVEAGPPVTLTEFRLDAGAYRTVAEHRGTATLGLGATLDLDALG